ncbi:histidine phosphatase family protein [Micromonospora chersina]|uniref:histidine phosphatase family protein n=1 Tax=Micromonospora chersina TaxID=47854 RepID=UPI0033D0D92D
MPSRLLYLVRHAEQDRPEEEADTGLPEPYAAFLAGFTERERLDGPRVTAEAVARFAIAPAEGDVRELVITHNFLVAWLVRHALEAPEARWIGLNHQNAGLTVIRYTPAAPPTLIALNDVAHLPPDLRATGLPPAYRL